MLWCSCCKMYNINHRIESICCNSRYCYIDIPIVYVTTSRLHHNDMFNTHSLRATNTEAYTIAFKGYITVDNIKQVYDHHNKYSGLYHLKTVSPIKPLGFIKTYYSNSKNRALNHTLNAYYSVKPKLLSVFRKIYKEHSTLYLNQAQKRVRVNPSTT